MPMVSQLDSRGARNQSQTVWPQSQAQAQGDASPYCCGLFPLPESKHFMPFSPRRGTPISLSDKVPTLWQEPELPCLPPPSPPVPCPRHTHTIYTPLTLTGILLCNVETMCQPEAFTVFVFCQINVQTTTQDYRWFQHPSLLGAGSASEAY